MNKHTLDDLQKKNPEFTSEIAQAVTALKAGQRARAQRLLGQLVRNTPNNATAWFWLGQSVEAPERQAYCRERVKKLDEVRAQETGQPGEKKTCRSGDRRSKAGQRSKRRTWLAAAVMILIVATCAATPRLAKGTTDEVMVYAQTNGVRLEASGMISADQVDIASEYGGTIEAVQVREGQTVQAGDVLVQLDTNLIDAQIKVAQAALDLAKAGLTQAQAGARAGKIETAKARLAQAEVAREVAQQAVTDTLTMLYNPQELLLQIEVTDAESHSAEHKLAQALALKDAAQIGKDRFQDAQQAIRDAGGPGPTRFRVKVAQGPISELLDRLPPEIRDQLPSADGTYTFGDTEVEIHGGQITLYRWTTIDLSLPFEAHLAPNIWWQSWIGVNVAAAGQQGVQSKLDQLYVQFDNPLSLRAQVDQATAAVEASKAQVGIAEAQVKALEAGASTELIATLESQVQQAQAALDSLYSKRAQMTLLAPIDGMVTAVLAHDGEIAAQGAALVTISNLNEVYLTVYLPETQLGYVQTGQSVQVRIDSFRDRTFEGTVTHIADQAQFTPRNISTREERVNLVFAIEIRLDNAEGELKPGMPADAVWGN